MRKGTILIFTEDADTCFDYLVHTLPNITNFKHCPRSFKINEYAIKIFKSINSDRMRGYRPEIIYYFDNTYEIPIYYSEKRYINDVTLYKSQRKQPIRYINNMFEINLKELINDDYSLLQCNFKKINWKDKLKYIILKIKNKFRRI